MEINLNTSNANSRVDALNIIIKKMTKSSLYCPVAYKNDGSGCSCCLSEYFYIICKINNEYKIFWYNGYIIHKNDCHVIRCSCYNNFIWTNINPVELNFVEFVDELCYSDKKYEICNNIDRLFEYFTSIDNNLWQNEFENYYYQQKENEEIYLYNENNNDEIMKNYDYYFN
jgi:hypothetical protein